MRALGRPRACSKLRVVLPVPAEPSSAGTSEGAGPVSDTSAHGASPSQSPVSTRRVTGALGCHDGVHTRRTDCLNQLLNFKIERQTFSLYKARV
jgi:hypothetical protein